MAPARPALGRVASIVTAYAYYDNVSTECYLMAMAGFEVEALIDVSVIASLHVLLLRGITISFNTAEDDKGCHYAPCDCPLAPAAHHPSFVA